MEKIMEEALWAKRGAQDIWLPQPPSWVYSFNAFRGKSMISDANRLLCDYPAELALIRCLAEQNYFAKYKVAVWGGVMPQGLSGSELLELSKAADKENKLRFKMDPMEECARRGAL